MTDSLTIIPLLFVTLDGFCFGTSKLKAVWRGGRQQRGRMLLFSIGRVERGSFLYFLIGGHFSGWRSKFRQWTKAGYWR
jgi:hypothetical protein